MNIDYGFSDCKFVDFSRHPALKFDTDHMKELFEEVRVDEDGGLIISTLRDHNYFETKDSIGELEQFAQFLLAFAAWKRSE